MKNLLVALLLPPIFSIDPKFTPVEIKRFEAEAKQVTIVWDNYGVTLLW